jgi:hypothetical protein
MAVSNLQFSPTDPAAQLLWTDVWYGEVRAHAQDSDSAPADDYNELLGNDGSVQATADTAHVDSKATYDVTDGDLVALDPSGQIGATTHSGLLLTQPNKQGDGFATSDFDNYFMVTGGATGESVEVTFTLDYSGQLAATADAEGYFRVELAALLQLWETDLIGYDIVADSKEGTATSVGLSYTGTLSVTANLVYDQEYWLYARADSEVYGATTPEPGTLALLLFGAGLIVRRTKVRFQS